HVVMHITLFFSSRRRHTRFSRDWSSDVCSSDLIHFSPRDGGLPACSVRTSARPSGSAFTKNNPSPRLPLWLIASSGNSVSPWSRSEEHTSELQSRENLVCRLLLEKKNKKVFILA